MEDREGNNDASSNNINNNNHGTANVEQTAAEMTAEPRGVSDRPASGQITTEAAPQVTTTRSSPRVRRGVRAPKLIRCGSHHEKMAKICCTCGIIFIATGGGLIIVYIMGMYTTFFGDLSNPSALSIPGFSFLFAGITATVFGVVFCWACPRRARRARRGGGAMTTRELQEAGFGLPGAGSDSSSGYYNSGLVIDPPPAYSDILTLSSTSVSTVELGEISVSTSVAHLPRETRHRPPAYVDAVKAKWYEAENGGKATRTAVQVTVVAAEDAVAGNHADSDSVAPEEIDPPAYHEVDVNSEHEC